MKNMNKNEYWTALGFESLELLNKAAVGASSASKKLDAVNESAIKKLVQLGLSEEEARSL